MRLLLFAWILVAFGDVTAQGAELSAADSSSAALSSAPGFATVAFAPSPFSLVVQPAPDGLTVRYRIPVEGHVELVLLDGAGVPLLFLVDAVQPSGEHELQWAGSESVAFVLVRSGAFAEALPIAPILEEGS